MAVVSVQQDSPYQHVAPSPAHNTNTNTYICVSALLAQRHAAGARSPARAGQRACIRAADTPTHIYVLVLRGEGHSRAGRGPQSCCAPAQGPTTAPVLLLMMTMA